MSITARRTLPPSNMLARVFDPPERFDRLGPIARHVGEVGARHRLRGTTAAGVCRSGADQCREQWSGQYLQHVLLFVASMTRRKRIARTLIKLVFNDNFRTINGPMRRSQPAGRRQVRRPSIAAAAAAILGLASASGVAYAAPQIGAAAPALVLTALDGQTFDLAKLRGKVVLVNYWATWCAPCRKDMPKLDAFYRSHQQQNLELIGISVDRDRDLQKVRKVMASLAYPGAVLKEVTVDGFGPPEGVPITWIIDADGKVRDRMIEVRDELLMGIVVPLLPP